MCAGDIAGYQDQLDATITLLEENNCQAIIGNHDLKYLAHHEEVDSIAEHRAISFLKQLPATPSASSGLEPVESSRIEFRRVALLSFF